MENGWFKRDDEQKEQKKVTGESERERVSQGERENRRILMKRNKKD